MKLLIAEKIARGGPITSWIALRQAPATQACVCAERRAGCSLVTGEQTTLTIHLPYTPSAG